MGQYRKKPVVIEAVEYAHGKVKLEEIPEWYWDALADRKVIAGDNDTLLITTLEGVMVAQRGDFIIRGVKGELYPCRGDIFKETYEAVEC